MSEDHKHRARIFLHRGQLAQARAAYEQAVSDDRLANDQPALSDSLGNLGNVCALSGDLEHAEARNQLLGLFRKFRDSSSK